MLWCVVPMHARMTTTIAGPEQDSPIAQRLRAARDRAGLALDEALQRPAC
jgi:hypothetical protein